MRYSPWIFGLAAAHLVACAAELSPPSAQDQTASSTPRLVTQDPDDPAADADPTSAGSDLVRPRFGTFTGNHFRIVNGVWFWEDSIGSQCGRDRVWTYTPVPGASVRQAGICPQGYPWFEMVTF